MDKNSENNWRYHDYTYLCHLILETYDVTVTQIYYRVRCNMHLDLCVFQWHHRYGTTLCISDG